LLVIRWFSSDLVTEDKRRKRLENSTTRQTAERYGAQSKVKTTLVSIGSPPCPLASHEVVKINIRG
jgi:hypothetical protein